jgi:hypothetical protein
MNDKVMTPLQIAAALAAPFADGEVKWRKGARGMMLPYVHSERVSTRAATG